ncbi:MAG: hypothetical protein ACP5U2_05345 [Bryobacteraceae bacterium]|jgi:hypothetical protein
MLRLRVETYSGYKADERPLRFSLGQRWYEVREVLDRWYGPQDVWFRVRADDGCCYVLRRRCFANEDFWTLEAFRR